MDLYSRNFLRQRESWIVNGSGNTPRLKRLLLKGQRCTEHTGTKKKAFHFHPVREQYSKLNLATEFPYLLVPSTPSVVVVVAVVLL